MADIEKIKSAIIEICRERKAKDVLVAVNGKRTYKEISEIAKCHPTDCSRILNKAQDFGLIVKEEGNWKKLPEFKHLKVPNVLKEVSSDIPKNKNISVRKRKKVTDTSQVKKQIKNLIKNHFDEIIHPYNGEIVKIKQKDIDLAADQLFDNLKEEGPLSLKGLEARFYESFSAYYSSDRIRKVEFTNNFSSLIKLFEPYVKKVSTLRTNDVEMAKKGLGKELLSSVVTLKSNINKSKDNYWMDKPIHEASIRIVYPYRHIEAHEARNYTIFQMERIIYYFFASIIFINLDIEL